MRAVESRAEGSALIWAMLFVIIASGMVVSHSAYMAANRRQIDVRYRLTTLASTFAKSGLTDALGWFQRQANQPVVAFAPKSDPGGDPPLLDTLDPTVGLVREFEVRGSLWARYEVQTAEVVDISLQRGETQIGSVWEVGSRGYIYRLVDLDKPFDQAPNRVVAMTNVRTEMRGIPLLPPAAAALTVSDPSKVTILAGGAIAGGSNPGIAYSDTAMSSTPMGNAVDVGGTPAIVPVFNFDTSPEKVFGMRLDQIKSLADFVIRGADALPGSVPRDKVVFVHGNLAMKKGQSVRGNTLLVVDGDLTIPKGAIAILRGLLYVTGNVSIAGKFALRGSLISKGTVTLGGGLETVRIVYDQAAVKSLKKGLARYRLARFLRPSVEVPH